MERVRLSSKYVLGWENSSHVEMEKGWSLPRQVENNGLGWSMGVLEKSSQGSKRTHFSTIHAGNCVSNILFSFMRFEICSIKHT